MFASLYRTVRICFVCLYICLSVRISSCISLSIRKSVCFYVWISVFLLVYPYVPVCMLLNLLLELQAVNQWVQRTCHQFKLSIALYLQVPLYCDLPLSPQPRFMNI